VPAPPAEVEIQTVFQMLWPQAF